ncbi:MAG: helix-turn-helix domain-containing protein [Clostridia bacterium]|nr:helix-turn-helix domain-containing protein [Clostridia bacterium]
MKKINEILKERRLELQLTMLDVAKSVGVSEGTISRWESGDIANMRRDKIAALATTLKISPSVIMGWEEDTNNSALRTPHSALPKGIIPISQLKRKKVPMLGHIACGKPIFADENRNEYVLADGDIKADFCLTCNGDSMTGARINDGDIVFIRQADMVDNGEIAAVIIEDEATLKRIYYYPEKNKLILNAENPKYEPLVYIGEELDHIRILGRAVAFQSVIR